MQHMDLAFRGSFYLNLVYIPLCDLGNCFPYLLLLQTTTVHIAILVIDFPAQFCCCDEMLK